MEKTKLELKAEIADLFLEIEKAKAFQEQAKQKIHELLIQIAEAKE